MYGRMCADTLSQCVQELRSKARHYEKTGLVPTLDASATVVKTDVLVEADLRDSLRQAFQRLQDDQAENPDWHPNSGDMVQDLVHPSMFPLVYGRTKALQAESVTVADAIEKWAGKGEVISKSEEPEQDSTGPRWRRTATLGSHDVPAEYWSTSYQWLPSNVSFQDDGSVKLMSYINSLHPTRYPEIYATIEELIERAIPAWDQCLLEYRRYTHYGPGRKGSRFSVPSGADDETEANWSPSDPAEVADAEIDISKDVGWDYVEDEAMRKWIILRKPVLREPEPFVEVEYDVHKVMVNLETPPGRFFMNPEAQPHVKTLIGGLREKFKDAGLQIIVKMASVELTPDKPEFPAGGWHIEGLLNEKICATALYYLDSENMTDSNLSFRMQTSYDQEELQDEVGQDSYHWMECNYGTRFSYQGGSCIQNYGSVNTCEGRLLAFPNVFQHRVSSFKLADPTKPGHRRFIALWLVDPHQRIISTANVAPQQQDWWFESVFGASVEDQKAAAKKLPADVAQLLRESGVELPGVQEKQAKLPNEILEMVRKEFSLSTFSLQEAKEQRLALMAERTSHSDVAVDEWNRASYNFCEH